jgi:acetyltransferase-like isoleucine patch superfamily enzyme
VGESNFFLSTKRRFARWIAEQLRAEELRQAKEYASFGPQAVLAQEGRIENSTGNKTRISIGGHSFVRGRLLTMGSLGRISLGEWCYVGPRSEIWSMDQVTIGNRVLIAHDVNIHDHTAHSIDPQERHAHFRHILEKGHPCKREDLPGIRFAPVTIEDDAWISFGVTILKGVRIGARSVIAAGSFVTKDVPPDVLYRNEVLPVVESLVDRLRTKTTGGH